MGGSHADCPVFDNRGLFVKSGGTGTTHLAMRLENRGTVRIDSGRLFVGCGYVQVNNFDPLPPAVDLPPGEQPEYIVVGDPTVGPPVLPPEEPIEVPQYTQSVTGALIEQILDHTPPGEFGIPGVDYGQLVVLGNVALDGTFEVQLLNGFVPLADQKYLVIDNRGSNAIDGTFIGLPEAPSCRPAIMASRSATSAAPATMWF